MKKERWRDTEMLPDTDAGLATAAALLKAGQTVAFPTETVYGLGADACNDVAVARVFDAKERPKFNPLIVHVASVARAREIGEFGDDAEALAATFWPGPLTLVVPLRPQAGLGDLVTAGLETVGLRVPASPVAQRLLEAFGGPLAAPSANPSGTVSPTRAAHVMEGLEGRIAAVVDGGPCGVGLESTIVQTCGEVQVLRPGGVPTEAIEAALRRPLAPPPSAPTRIVAPGQLSSHYAPRKLVRLNAETPRAGELWLAFGPGHATASANLSPSGDLVEAASQLFALLRDLDSRAGAGIAVAPIPEVGLGVAINDRLRRAAAPRT